MTGSSSDRPLAVAQIVTTMARGGAQATVIASSSASDLGSEVLVTVLCGPDRTDEGSYWDSPELSQCRTVVVPRLVRSVSPLDDLAAMLWLARWLRANRPDVVHTHSSKAGAIGRIAARLAGVPCVHTVHGWGPMAAAPRWARPAVRWLERRLARLCRALVVVGTPDREFGLANGVGRADQYRVIRSGVDITAGAAATADRPTIRSKFGIDNPAAGQASGPFVVGSVARMSRQKDHAALVAAFARAGISNSILVLIGDGPLRPAIEQQAGDLGLSDRVRFLGVRPDADRLVAGFDVSVLASRWEGLPRSVVEAAAAGIPVVASDVGAVSEFVESERTGLLVPPGDVERLAGALRSVHQNYDGALAMADSAVQRAEEFSSRRMRRDLISLWWEVADRSRPSEPPQPDPTPASTAEARPGPVVQRSRPPEAKLR